MLIDLKTAVSASKSHRYFQISKMSVSIRQPHGKDQISKLLESTTCTTV